MNRRIVCQDDRERRVVWLWRRSGVTPGSVITYLDWVHRFRAYCKNSGLDETSQSTRDVATRFADSYVGPRKRGPLAASSRLVCRTALHSWASALRLLKVPVPQWQQSERPTPLSPLLGAYYYHRQHHCGVANATLLSDIETAEAFLSILRSRNRTFGKTTVADIDAFVAELAKRCCRHTIARGCSSLRAFFRFLRTSGRVSRDLASCVVSPRVRMAERPSRTLPWAQVRRIFRCIRRTQAPGKRDLAMLLMMAAYGLGAGEILSLRLDDVDWDSEVLHVRRPKTGVTVDLPLLPAVARALAAYLQLERPRHAESRRIYLSMGLPHEPLTSGAIRHRIRLYARLAGIKAATLGAHVFRHSHASRQVDAGANLKVLSDILGHRRPSSTSVYVRVALRRLHTVALPVPQ